MEEENHINVTAISSEGRGYAGEDDAENKENSGGPNAPANENSGQNQNMVSRRTLLFRRQNIPKIDLVIHHSPLIKTWNLSD